MCIFFFLCYICITSTKQVEVTVPHWLRFQWGGGIVQRLIFEERAGYVCGEWNLCLVNNPQGNENLKSSSLNDT